MLSRRDALLQFALCGAAPAALASVDPRLLFDMPAQAMSRKDRDRFTLTKRKWPVVMASPDKPYSYAEWGRAHRFELRKGDVCMSVDGAKAGQKACPERCGIGWLGQRPFFTPLRFAFDFMVSMDGPNQNPWTLIAQYHNHADVVAPGVFEPWCSPPLAIMLAPDPTRKGGTMLTVSGRYVPDRITVTCPAEMILGRIPFQFDVKHHLDVTFVDGRGGPGSVKATMNGAMIADYKGPIGFNDEAGTYFSFGAYRSPFHPDDQNIIARFANVEEGPLT